MEFFERFVFVRKCAGCGEILPYERTREGFCLECDRVWHIAKAENCSECLRVVTECTCTPKGLRGVRSLRKLIFYHPQKVNDPQNQLIYKLKHRPNRRLSEFVAAELSSAVEEEIAECGFADRREDVLLVNMPRGRTAKIAYGFDQSVLLCRALSKTLGIAHVEAVGRRSGGSEQKKLTGALRFQNVRGLFYLRDDAVVAGKCILLVDDIVTTGASMAGCAKLLKKAGAKEILAFCIAQD